MHKFVIFGVLRVLSCRLFVQIINNLFVLCFCQFRIIYDHLYAFLLQFCSILKVSHLVVDLPALRDFVTVGGFLRMRTALKIALTIDEYCK